MKRIILTIMLAAAALTVSAQNIFKPYASYSLKESQNKLSDILRCESSMTLVFGYANFAFQNPTPLGAAGGPTFTLHGLKYEGEYIMPVWGPFGIDFNYLGFNAGFGNYNGQFATHMSWNVGIMPLISVNLGRKFTVQAFGGVKWYLSFLMDGTDSFSLTDIDGATASIGKGSWLSTAYGVSLVFGTWGMRLSCEDALSGRLKDKYYTQTGTTRELYDPRYRILSASVFFNFEL